MAIGKSSAAGATSGAAGAITVPCDPSRLGLQVQEVTYLNHHNINNDTLLEFGAPQWKLGRAADPSPAVQSPAQYPVAYTRNTKIKLTVKFKVTQRPTCATPVWIKGIFKITAKSTMEWVKRVTIDPSDAFIVVTDVLSNNPLPDYVTYYTPFSIEWIYNTGTSSVTRKSAGSSKNPLYVLLGNPMIRTSFYTSVHHSCRAAKGCNDPVATLKAIYKIFMGAQARPPQPVRRKRDGKTLCYWNPAVDAKLQDARSRGTPATEILLSSSKGNARCGEWSIFMIDICRNHNIRDVELIGIDTRWSDVGMLVKNWKFRPSPRTPPFPATLGRVLVTMTHSIAGADFYTYGASSGECINAAGVAAQGNPDPQPFFTDHAIVRYKGQYYDPSYGTPIRDSELAWESNSLDGVSNLTPVAGRHPGVQVFDFTPLGY